MKKKITCQLRHLARGQGKDSHTRECPKLQKDQFAYCKEMGHWAKNFRKSAIIRTMNQLITPAHVWVAESSDHSD